MSTIKVDGIRSNGDTSGNDAITLVDNNTCTANITNNLSNRNKIINGAMEVAQRGTSSNSSGYQTVDRFSHSGSGWDNAMTQEQGTVASGTTPYTLGFRKSFKITNGDQTGGAGTGDYLHAVYCVEDQDLATSGWNYTSTSSYITLSFWVKSSVAQNFYFYLQSDNGSQYRYVMETGSLTAGQWTKVTKTIPGNSNLVLNNDTGEGMFIVWNIFDGTDRTGTRPLNAWAALDNAARTPDQTQTWYTTNDATWELTGVQLEVSNYATDFEHRPYYVEEKLCKRYFCKYVGPLNINFVNEHANNKKGYLHFPYEEVMRDTPSVSFTNVGISRPQVSVGRSISEAQNIQKRCFNLVGWPNESALGSHGDAYYRMSVNSTNGYITCDAEL